MKEQLEIGEEEGAYSGGTDDGFLAEPLAPPPPVAHEWSSMLLGFGGALCVGGAIAIAAQRLGLIESSASISALIDRVAGAGASPALLAIGGTVLLGQAAAGWARRRNVRRTLEEFGQTPDYGLLLQDIDDNVQRLHVNLVTVEARISGAVEGTSRELGTSMRTALASDPQSAELGARLMRLEATLGQLATAISRLEQRTSEAPGTASVAQIVDRLESLSARLESVASKPVPQRNDAAPEASAPSASTPAKLEPQRATPNASAPIAASPRPAAAASVERPKPAIPTPTEMESGDPAIEDSAIDGLPLFASVEEPVRRAKPSERAARNPYERGQ